MDPAIDISFEMSQFFQLIPKMQIGILATPGGLELAKKIDRRLIEQRLSLQNKIPELKKLPNFIQNTFIIDSTNPRFNNGEGKARIHETVRGYDLYFIADVNNWGISYTRNNSVVAMAPDEHFQDLKRLIAASRGLGARMNVIMPLLYESRQHKINGRESLDCAIALQELVNMGVQNIMTIDAHNAHVQNAIPGHAFENLHANYQMIKALINSESDFKVGPENLIIVSPDLGGLERCRYYAEQLQAELTAFYKLRDMTKVINGRTPIIEHKFLGGHIRNKIALVVDDMIASGDSVLEVAKAVKRMGARKTYISCSFSLFTEGISRFNAAYKKGLFNAVFSTNATYIPPDLAAAPWFKQVDISRLIALYIDAFNRNESVGKLLDNSMKIRRLLIERGLLPNE